MLIVLALVIGAVLGTAAHFLIGGRELRGASIGPVLGTVVAALAWMILTWAGQGPDTAWPWLAAIVAPAVLTPLALRVLTRRRAEHDAQERRRLGIA